MTLLAQYRPRRATEILDASVRIYGAHWTALLLISAAVVAPPAALGAIAPEGLGRFIDLAGNLLLPVGQGAISLVVAAALEERPIDAGEAFAGLTGRVGTLVWLQFAAGLLIAVGLILLVVPGILALVWTAVALPAAAIERVPTGKALRRSRALARGHAGHVLATLGLAFVLVIALFLGSGLAVGALTAALGLGDRLVGFLGALLFVPLFPLFAVAVTLLYFDLRVRREGADLEAMAAALPA